MSVHVHRVTVRGFFDGLDDRQRELLREAQPDHDMLEVFWSEEGSLAYEPNPQAFSFRFEVRTTGDDGVDRNAAAVQRGLSRAQAALAGMGVGYKRLRATATDMADVWREPDA